MCFVGKTVSEIFVSATQSAQIVVATVVLATMVSFGVAVEDPLNNGVVDGVTFQVL